MAAKGTRAQRVRYKIELDAYEKNLAQEAEKKEKALLDADMELTNTLFEVLAGTIEDEATDQGPNGTDERSEKPSDESHLAQASTAVTGSPFAIEETPRESNPAPSRNGLKQDDAAESESSKAPQPQTPPPTHNDLKMWHEHNLVEAEARARNGYGRLNLQEFKRKLRSEVADDIDVGDDGKDDENFWEAKADLGKFSFLSTWIEMASF